MKLIFFVKPVQVFKRGLLLRRKQHPSLVRRSRLGIGIAVDLFLVIADDAFFGKNIHHRLRDTCKIADFFHRRGLHIPEQRNNLPLLGREGDAIQPVGIFTKGCHFNIGVLDFAHGVVRAHQIALFHQLVRNRRMRGQVHDLRDMLLFQHQSFVGQKHLQNLSLLRRDVVLPRHCFAGKLPGSTVGSNQPHIDAGGEHHLGSLIIGAIVIIAEPFRHPDHFRGEYRCIVQQA